jgi:hypothetical protein
MVTFSFARSIHVPSISSFHFPCIFRSSITVSYVYLVLYLATCENKSCTLPSVATKVSVITCESKHLIFVTPKLRSHCQLSVKGSEGAPSPMREVSISDDLSAPPTTLHRWWSRAFATTVDTGIPSSIPLLLYYYQSGILHQLRTSFIQGFRGSLCLDIFVC